MLGAQVVLGLQFNSVFQGQFDSLPMHARLTHLSAMGLQLITIAILITPTCLHQLSEKGEDTARFHRSVTALLGLALPPFAVALGLETGVATENVLGPGWAWVL